MKAPVRGGILDGEVRQRPPITSKIQEAFAHYQKGLGFHLYQWKRSEGVWEFVRIVAGRTEQDLLDALNNDPNLKGIGL